MALLGWQAIAAPADSTTAITLGYSVSMPTSVYGGTRQLNIYLPPGYDTQKNTTYPVIYLLDGGLDEDFVHVAGLIQFATQPWVKFMKPCILVGVTNVDRLHDMTGPTTVEQHRKAYPTTGGADDFIRFLKTDLEPYIRAHYRVSHSSTLIGESLGGLLATNVLLHHPRMFSNYIIISPSLWWNSGAMLNEPITKALNKPYKANVFIAVGKEGLTPDPNPSVMEVDANKLADKLSKIPNPDLHIYFDYLPSDTHATIAYQALYNAIRKIGKEL